MEMPPQGLPSLSSSDGTTLLPSPGDPTFGSGKRFFIIVAIGVGVLVIFLLGTFLFSKMFTKNDTKSASNTALQLATNAATANAAADEDNDGLINGDEQKYGTDPQNPDTDGDGFPDGAEIKNGYDPKGAGKLQSQNRF